jgi:short-subunit dehydrogenase
MNKRIPPVRAIVTGASSGIGAALSHRLASRGIEVWLAARRKDVLDEEVNRIRERGGHAHAVALDIAQADVTYDTLSRLDKEVGGIDLVIANAAMAGSTTAVNLAKSSWSHVRDILHTNLIGAVATLMPFIPGMLERGHGHLVGISSTAADYHNPRATAYGASKSGLTHFLESAAIELKPKGINVTIVHPGFVRTPALDGFKESLPFLVELEEAVQIIDKGIEQRVAMIRFPWIYGVLVRFINLLPRRIEHSLIRKLTRLEQ